MKIRLYLAGPMSGIEGLNIPAFKDAANALRKSGFEVLSPHEIEEPGSWLQAMAADFNALSDFDPHGVAFLPGWDKSPGARIERIAAERHNWITGPVESWLFMPRRGES